MERLAIETKGVRRYGAVALALWLTLAGAAMANPGWQTYLYGGDCYAAAGSGDEAWIAAGDGLHIYRPAADGADHRRLTIDDDLPGPTITAVAFVPGGLWAAAAGGAVGRYDFETKTWAHYAQAAQFPAFEPTDLCFDGADMWASTMGGGVSQFSPLRSEWRSWGLADGLPSDRVLCLAADANHTWAGTDRGLAVFDRAAQVWQPITAGPEGQELLADTAVDLALSPKYLWIASANHGLARISREDGTLQTYDNLTAAHGVSRVSRLLVTTDNQVWVATDVGLLRGEQEGDGLWTALAHEPWTVTGLASAGGSIWVALEHDGVREYRPAEDRWIDHRAAEPLPSGTVTALAAAPEAGYVGFAQGGAAKLDLASGQWQKLGELPGAPQAVVGLAVQDRWLYAAALDGLCMYDTREQTWHRLAAADYPELRGDDWTGVATGNDGAWYIGPGRVAHVGAQLEPRWCLDLVGETNLDPRAWPRLVPDETTGDMWIITSQGALRHDRANNRLQSFGGEWLLPTDTGLLEREGRLIRDLVADYENVWIVSLDAVWQYRKLDGSLSRWSAANVPGLADPRFVGVSPAAVWVAATSALFRFDRRLGAWTTLSWPEEMQGEPITALSVDPYEQRYIWAGSSRHTARLELTDRDPVWRVYPRRTGLVPGVNRIVPTRSAVWFAGRGGISVYRRDLSALAQP